jgi:hypothetical protein
MREKWDNDWPLEMNEELGMYKIQGLLVFEIYKSRI